MATLTHWSSLQYKLPSFELVESKKRYLYKMDSKMLTRATSVKSTTSVAGRKLKRFVVVDVKRHFGRITNRMSSLYICVTNRNG